MRLIKFLLPSLPICLCLVGLQAHAGAQKEETLADNVASAMRRSINSVNPPRLVFANAKEGEAWLNEMSRRLEKRVPDEWERKKLLVAVHYEATRAGLDPQLVLGLIEVESGFRRYAVSPVGAKGVMQVMPFWVRYIGTSDHNLFDLTTNLRFGCTILRQYLAMENGNLFRALGRYNGSLGRSAYPDAVIGAWKSKWHWDAGNPSLMRVSR